MKKRIVFLLVLGVLGACAKESWSRCHLVRARDFEGKGTVGCTMDFLIVDGMDFKTVDADSDRSPFSPEQEKEIDEKSSGLLIFAGKTNRWEKISFLLVPPKTTTIYEGASRRYVLEAKDIKIVEDKDSVPVQFFLDSTICFKCVEFVNSRKSFEMPLWPRFPLTGKFRILGGASTYSTADVEP